MTALWSREQRGAAWNRALLEKTEKSIAKLIDAIKNGVDPVLIRDEINDLQARTLELQASPECTEETPIFIHPNMVKRYHDEVQRLVTSLNEPEHRGESAEIIRKLVEKIVLSPNEECTKLAINLYGDLAGILQVSAGHNAAHHYTALGGPGLAAVTEIQQVRLLTDKVQRREESAEQSYVGSAGWGGRIRICDPDRRMSAPEHEAALRQRQIRAQSGRREPHLMTWSGGSARRGSGLGNAARAV